MIKIENTEVVGWEAAIRGMRNPMNSWRKSDSYTGFGGFNSIPAEDKGEYDFCIGFEDQKLMMNLRNAGTDHRKFMRMIVVYTDILAPLYWWKEFDTYKVGTVANSCSTMHKIADKEFTLEDFSCEHLISYKDYPKYDCFAECPSGDGVVAPYELLKTIIELLNKARHKYLETKDKKYWWQMIQLLPSSYNQRRTVMMNYEVLANIYKSRKNHKLDEWHDFCDWIKTLPYSELIMGEEGQSLE